MSGGSALGLLGLAFIAVVREGIETVLFLFAAGLLAVGIHEFHEAGIIPVVIEHVWDINHILPEASIIGRFLTAVFGCNAGPSLPEVIAYAVFLGAALAGYFYPSMHRQRAGANT